MPGIVSRLIAEFPHRVRKQAAANSKEAAVFVQQKLREALGRSHPPASRPGQFPARRSGRLQSEAYAKAEVIGDAVVITVALPTPYAERLAATGRIGPRAIVEQNRAQVEEILLRKGYGRRR